MLKCQYLTLINILNKNKYLIKIKLKINAIF